MRNRLVPTPVSPRLLGGARVGRWHELAEELALAFAMGTHAWLGAGAGVTGSGGRRRSRRARKDDRGCPYLMIHDAGGSGEAGGGGVQMGGGGVRECQGGSAAADGKEEETSWDVRDSVARHCHVSRRQCGAMKALEPQGFGE